MDHPDTLGEKMGSNDVPRRPLRLVVLLLTIGLWPVLALDGSTVVALSRPLGLLVLIGLLAGLAACGGGAARNGLRFLAGGRATVSGARFLHVAGTTMLGGGLLVGLVGALLLFACLGLGAVHPFREPAVLAGAVSIAFAHPLAGVLVGRLVFIAASEGARLETGVAPAPRSDLVPLLATMVPPVVFLGAALPV